MQSFQTGIVEDVKSSIESIKFLENRLKGIATRGILTAEEKAEEDKFIEEKLIVGVAAYVKDGSSMAH